MTTSMVFEDGETRPQTEDEAAQAVIDSAAAEAAAALRAEKEALATSARLKIAESSGLTADEIAALGF